MHKIGLFAPLALWAVLMLPADATSSPELEPFAGSWAFRLPDGNPAWLGIPSDGTATLLWSVGSARPVEQITAEGGELSFVRKFNWQPFGEGDTCRVSKPMVGRINPAGQLVLTVRQNCQGKEQTLVLEGKHMPPLPPAPDLSRVQFDAAIDLLCNGLADWCMTNPKKQNGWRCEDGVLINATPKTDFSAYGAYGNLRTRQTFMDFELTLEYNVPAGGNSGIYLRGAYEVQVVDRDSRMQGIQGPGAVFGRIRPTENAAHPGGQWNRYRLLLVDRHITVELNGKRVIDNAPLEGCTGGGIHADDTLPGPIFLQGDHTSVQYRNMVLRPVATLGD